MVIKLLLSSFFAVFLLWSIVVSFIFFGFYNVLWMVFILLLIVFPILALPVWIMKKSSRQLTPSEEKIFYYLSYLILFILIPAAFCDFVGLSFALGNRNAETQTKLIIFFMITYTTSIILTALFFQRKNHKILYIINYILLFVCFIYLVLIGAWFS